jgi:4a-hydroxytetrahydrobiopterin dehydratase
LRRPRLLPFPFEATSIGKAKQGGQLMTAQAGQKTFGAPEIETRLKAELPRWQFRDGNLCRTYQMHGWKATLMAVNAIGHVAEIAWHHPDLMVTYNSIEVRLMSHDVKGITERDFALAKKIEELLLWQPGSPFSSPPDDPRYAYIKHS